MMNQPLGRVIELQYRDEKPKLAIDSSALVVRFRAPDAEVYEHPLENGEWLIGNAALQFMAINNIKPSDIEGTKMNVESWVLDIPVAPDGDGGYLIAQNAMSDAESALREAEWFGAYPSEKPNSGHPDAPDDDSDGGGGSPARVDDDTGVEIVDA